MTSAATLVESAQRIADEVLFPAAVATDAAALVPVEQLDVLASAGLYGVAAPVVAGGAGDDFQATCAVVEALASGCLTTAFVWAQHLGASRAAMLSDNEEVRSWTPYLFSGERRAGLALGGALQGEAQLTASITDGGWLMTGSSPFVSGWGRVDVIHTAARTVDDRLVWALVDARESATLAVEPLSLVALNATGTVSAHFHSHHVGADRVTAVEPYAPGPAPPAVLRIHSSLALGVAARCCQLLGPTLLDEELVRCRADLDRLDPKTIEGDRAAAADLALRCAAALLVASGSRSLMLDRQQQRLAREALFTVVYALRPGTRAALLERFGAAPR